MKARVSEQFRPENSAVNQNIRNFIFNMQAGNRQKLDHPGETLTLKSASGPVVFYFNGSNRIELNDGDSLRRNFDYVEIESATTQQIEIVAGFGDFSSNSLTVANTVSVDFTPGNQLDALAAVSVAATSTGVVATADADQRELIVSIDSTQPGGLYIGGSTVSASLRGFWLAPGSTMSISTEAEVRAYNAGAAAVTINACRNKRV